MQYYILSTPGQADELARWRRRSVAAYYDPTSQRWVPDPLLAVEILAGEDWKPIDVSDLPPGLPDVDTDRRSHARTKERVGGRRRRR